MRMCCKNPICISPTWFNTEIIRRRSVLLIHGNIQRRHIHLSVYNVFLSNHLHWQNTIIQFRSSLHAPNRNINSTCFIRIWEEVFSICLTILIRPNFKFSDTRYGGKQFVFFGCFIIRIELISINICFFPKSGYNTYQTEKFLSIIRIESWIINPVFVTLILSGCLSVFPLTRVISLFEPIINI